ncbi:MAG: DegT/DnrJ/EryC1/StrS family aminotransferase [Bacteroidales bacterium]|nr:DegT/DnrJ/EryC1/StrS family aminotransferase [Bacteroidales bacterium]
MREIRMVDLKTQYEKIKNEIDKAIQQVLDSTAFINGSEVRDFKLKLEEYLNIPYVIPCGNGTDALLVSMMALDLKPGDEVITPGFTFIATVEAIALLGLTPVIVDVNPDTFTIAPEAVREAITDKTRAIIPVHLFGQCADMDKILNLAKQNNLFVIEDTAQAMGAEFIPANNTRKKAGTIGDIGCTSFFPSKNLACYGDGGAVFTHDKNLAEKITSIVNHGSKKKYYHERIGVNSRLDTLQAAILNVKIRYLDQYNVARQLVAGYYDKAFQHQPKLKIPVRANYSSHVFHQYTLQLENTINREDLMAHLKSKGIPSMVYYPVPMHKQPAFESFQKSYAEFPVTEKLCKTVLSLPIHTEMDEEQLNYITRTLMDFIN